MKKQHKMTNEIIIDAQGAVAGRLASFAAKKALQGNKIIILNSEKAIIIGKKSVILKKFLRKRALGKGVQKGPHYPSKPDMILRRMIRGMLPWKRTRGRETFREIQCVIGIGNYHGREKEAIKLEKKEALNYLTLQELSKLVKHTEK
jgi:large subunit ribosomal protein L13